MSKYIKNNTGSDKTWAGQLINAGSYYEIQSSEEDQFAKNSLLLSDIGSGDAIIAKDDSGTTDITDVSSAIDCLKNNLPQIVEVQGQQPFAAKTLPDGRRLFAREHGITGVTIASGATGSLVLEIPYATCKITDAEILGCQLGDTVNFKILDTDAGLLTTIPLYPVNQFGYDVNMPDGRYNKKYAYDADLFIGLHVSIEYKNNGPDPITVSANIGIHEVKV